MRAGTLKYLLYLLLSLITKKSGKKGYAGFAFVAREVGVVEVVRGCRNIYIVEAVRIGGEFYWISLLAYVAYYQQLHKSKM